MTEIEISVLPTIRTINYRWKVSIIACTVGNEHALNNLQVTVDQTEPNGYWAHTQYI